MERQGRRYTVRNETTEGVYVTDDKKPEDLKQFRDWKERTDKAGTLAFEVPQDFDRGDSDNTQDDNDD